MSQTELKEEIKMQIDSLQDDLLLQEINQLLGNNTKNDWWNEIPISAQNNIIEGYQDWKNSRVISHEEVMMSLKK